MGAILAVVIAVRANASLHGLFNAAAIHSFPDPAGSLRLGCLKQAVLRPN